MTQKAPYKGLGAESGEKREPVSDIALELLDSLKVLDPDGRLEKFVCPLEPAVTLTARSPKRLFHLVFESHDGRALVPSPESPERSASP